MANQAIANKVLKGSGGNLWFNGQILSTLSKVEAKVKGTFEDVNFCGDNSTYSVYNGWAGEGTITIKKVDSTIWKMCADAFKSGVMPDIKIITALTDKSTGQSERASIEQITITEFNLVNFEAKKIVEESFPFKFSNYEVLEAIA